MAKDFPTRDQNYSEWYNQLVIRAGLAENSSVRGCMVIKPYGYAIWERMQQQLEQHVQSNRAQQCIFSTLHPKIIL